MKVDLEFNLRVGDDPVVGEFSVTEMAFVPPLGSLLYMYGVRFTVSDVITKFDFEEYPFQESQTGTMKMLEYSVKIECSCSFENDDAFVEALCKLAHSEIRFDEEMLIIVEEETDCRLPRNLHLRKASAE